MICDTDNSMLGYFLDKDFGRSTQKICLHLHFENGYIWNYYSREYILGGDPPPRGDPLGQRDFRGDLGP